MVALDNILFKAAIEFLRNIFKTAAFNFAVLILLYGFISRVFMLV